VVADRVQGLGRRPEGAPGREPEAAGEEAHGEAHEDVGPMPDDPFPE
jgi:hypothetical protein